MGMAAAGGSENGGRRRSRRRAPMSEINVTPFVDVMLVLLIIFMVTAPLLTVGVPLDLPQTKAGAVSADTQPITISVDREGKVFLQETEISIGEIGAKLKAIQSNREGEETRIMLRGDVKAFYEPVARVLGELQSAGFRKITMLSLPADNR